MGDGQHIWASSEWVNYLRNCLVFEEEQENQLILGAGIEPGWIQPGNQITIGPALTLWGQVSVTFDCQPKGIQVHLTASWYDDAPEVIINIPGYIKTRFESTETEVLVPKRMK